MKNNNQEKGAVLVIDMVKDNFDKNRNLPILPLARKIINPINRVTRAFRKKGWYVVFPTDAFCKDDFIFKESVKPHSLRGTVGAEIIDELEREDVDLWLPKPRFSAFFDTNLFHWLRERDVTMCALAGITSNFCVLATLFDSISFDFKTILLEDCCAAPSQDMHTQTLGIYRRNPLYPLLRVTSSKKLLSELGKQQS